MMRFFPVLLTLLFQYHVLASHRFPLPLSASITSSPNPQPSQHDDLAKRQITSQISTCGFDNGDPSKPRTADSGFNCRVDTKNGLWGFCPTTVLDARDCGLAGNCVDNHACTSGCGIFDTLGITTFTCTGSGQSYCSTALLIDGPDQTYSYIACAANSGVESLFADPKVTPTAAASSSTSRSLSPSKLQSSSALTMASSSSTFSTASLTRSSASNSISASPASATSALPPATTAISKSSQIPLGPIIGGLLGALAMICGLILGTLYLRRRPQNNHNLQSATIITPLDPTKGAVRHIPGAEGGSEYQQYGGYGPSELPTKRERELAELG